VIDVATTPPVALSSCTRTPGTPTSGADCSPSWSTSMNTRSPMLNCLTNGKSSVRSLLPYSTGRLGQHDVGAAHDERRAGRRLVAGQLGELTESS
jgi:hypothetical protein